MRHRPPLRHPEWIEPLPDTASVAVYCAVSPDLFAVLEEACGRRHALRTDPADPGEPIVVVRRHRLREDEVVGRLLAPAVVAGSQLAPAIRAALPVERAYATRVAVPAHLSPKRAAVMRELAVALAVSGQGVVFDVDAASLAWSPPPERPNLPTSYDELERVGCVQLGMSLARPLAARDAAAFLEVARRWYPAALPVGYGSEFPFAERFAPGSEGAFAARWEPAGAEAVRWGGRGTVSYGSAHQADGDPNEYCTLAGDPVVPLSGLHLAFSTATPDVEAHLDRLAGFVEALCAALDPLYAVVRRPPPRERMAESTVDPCWLGLPPHPEDWLVYAGAPYAPHLPADTPGRRAVGRGALVRRSASPFDDAALAAHPMAWPAELVRTGDPLEIERAARRIPPLGVETPGIEPGSATA